MTYFGPSKSANLQNRDSETGGERAAAALSSVIESHQKKKALAPDAQLPTPPRSSQPQSSPQREIETSTKPFAIHNAPFHENRPQESKSFMPLPKSQKRAEGHRNTASGQHGVRDTHKVDVKNKTRTLVPPHSTRQSPHHRVPSVTSTNGGSLENKGHYQQHREGRNLRQPSWNSLYDATLKPSGRGKSSSNRGPETPSSPLSRVAPIRHRSIGPSLTHDDGFFDKYLPGNDLDGYESPQSPQSPPSPFLRPQTKSILSSPTDTSSGTLYGSSQLGKERYLESKAFDRYPVSSKGSRRSEHNSQRGPLPPGPRVLPSKVSTAGPERNTQAQKCEVCGDTRYVSVQNYNGDRVMPCRMCQPKTDRKQDTKTSNSSKSKPSGYFSRKMWPEANIVAQSTHPAVGLQASKVQEASAINDLQTAVLVKAGYKTVSSSLDVITTDSTPARTPSGLIRPAHTIPRIPQPDASALPQIPTLDTAISDANPCTLDIEKLETHKGKFCSWQAVNTKWLTIVDSAVRSSTLLSPSSAAVSPKQLPNNVYEVNYLKKLSAGPTSSAINDGLQKELAMFKNLTDQSTTLGHVLPVPVEIEKALQAWQQEPTTINAIQLKCHLVHINGLLRDLTFVRAQTEPPSHGAHPQASLHRLIAGLSAPKPPPWSHPKTVDGHTQLLFPPKSSPVARARPTFDTQPHSPPKPICTQQPSLNTPQLLAPLPKAFPSTPPQPPANQTAHPTKLSNSLPQAPISVSQSSTPHQEPLKVSPKISSSSYSQSNRQLTPLYTSLSILQAQNAPTSSTSTVKEPDDLSQSLRVVSQGNAPSPPNASQRSNQTLQSEPPAPLYPLLESAVIYTLPLPAMNANQRQKPEKLLSPTPRGTGSLASSIPEASPANKAKKRAHGSIYASSAKRKKPMPASPGKLFATAELDDEDQYQWTKFHRELEYQYQWHYKCETCKDASHGTGWHNAIRCNVCRSCEHSKRYHVWNKPRAAGPQPILTDSPKVEAQLHAPTLEILSVPVINPDLLIVAQSVQPMEGNVKIKAKKKGKPDTRTVETEENATGEPDHVEETKAKAKGKKTRRGTPIKEELESDAELSDVPRYTQSYYVSEMVKTCCKNGRRGTIKGVIQPGLKPGAELTMALPCLKKLKPGVRQPPKHIFNMIV